MSSRPDVVESWGPGWWDRWTAWAGPRAGELQQHVASGRHWVAGGVMHLEAARAAAGRWTAPFLCSKLLVPPSGGTLTARVRPALAAGHLPAVWLVGGTWPSSDWPKGGELDVLEALVSKTAGPIVHGNLHGYDPTKTGDARHWQDGVHVPARAGEWVTVGVELRSDRITWTVDDDVVHTWTAAQLPAGMAWPWRRASQLLLSTAVGNEWTGNPPADGPATVVTEIGELRWRWAS